MAFLDSVRVPIDCELRVSSPLDSLPDGLPTTDADLVAAVLRGDRGAFDLLVGRYQRQATALAYRLLGSVDDALEVSQEAFLKSYQKLNSLTRPQRFGPWLMCRIVSNQALNFRRGRALRRGVRFEDFTGDDDASGGGPL